MNSLDNPITSACPAEVPLPNAPLSRVIAQVRFPQILSIQKRDYVAAFQERIRDTYPVLRPEYVKDVVLGPDGAQQTDSPVIWRFLDGVDTWRWRLSLGISFIAIETTEYESRRDFKDRFAFMVRALGEQIAPKTIDRIGLRFIDRIADENLENIKSLVRPEMLGILSNEAAERLLHSVTDCEFQVPDSDARIRAKWGLLPPDATVDPAAVEPWSRPSWILDLDMFRLNSSPFEPENLTEEVGYFSERLYTFFRWAVTDDFLRTFGGVV